MGQKNTVQKQLSCALAFDDLEEASALREEIVRRRKLIREIKSFTVDFKRYPMLERNLNSNG